jgi:hypothetical protein
MSEAIPGERSQVSEYVICLTCGYPLRGLLDSGDCPECGTSIGESVSRWKTSYQLSRARLKKALLRFAFAGLADLVVIFYVIEANHLWNLRWRLRPWYLEPICYATALAVSCVAWPTGLWWLMLSRAPLAQSHSGWKRRILMAAIVLISTANLTTAMASTSWFLSMREPASAYAAIFSIPLRPALLFLVLTYVNPLSSRHTATGLTGALTAIRYMHLACVVAMALAWIAVSVYVSFELRLRAWADLVEPTVNSVLIATAVTSLLAIVSLIVLRCRIPSGWRGGPQPANDG